MSINIQIERDEATPLFNALYNSLSRGRREFLAVNASRVERRLKRHFREREAGDSKRRQRGWPQRHFWASVERATQIASLTNDYATITIASAPFAFKLRGGTITPRRGSYLSIPLRAEAYAAGSPRAWGRAKSGSAGRLVPIRSRSGRLVLAEVSGGSAQGIRAHYLLVRSVTQQADPRALPPQAEMNKEIESASLQFLERALNRRTTR